MPLKRAEEAMDESVFEYVTYISSSQEKVWNALIDQG